ncbi:RING-type E3 ubiquitin transferase [Plasmodiophora brassicae]
MPSSESGDDGDDDVAVCPICLGEIVHPTVANLTCLHQFCRDCIVRWVAVRPVCPVCRTGSPAALVGVVLTQQVLVRWRQLIYERGLRAIPTTSQTRALTPEQIRSPELRKWLFRELIAVCGFKDDPKNSALDYAVNAVLAVLLDLRTIGESKAVDILSIFMSACSRPRLEAFLHELQCRAYSALDNLNYDSYVRYREGLSGPIADSQYPGIRRRLDTRRRKRLRR